jgi:hypothetical protein
VKVKAERVKNDYAIVMRKRPARHGGEMGLFPENPMADEDFAKVRGGSDRDLTVNVTITSPQILADLKYCWGLAGKLADACDWLTDKEMAMDCLCVLAKHSRVVRNSRTGYEFTVRRSLTEFDGDGLRRFRNRIQWIVTNELLPDIDAGALRDAVEEWVTGQR